MRSASCRLSMHACNRSLLASGLPTDFHADVSALDARWQSKRRVPLAPIRTPKWFTRLSGQRRTQRHSCVAPLNTNATSSYRSEGCFLPYTFFLPIYLPWDFVPFRFGGSRHGRGLFVEETDSLQKAGLQETTKACCSWECTDRPCAR